MTSESNDFRSRPRGNQAENEPALLKALGHKMGGKSAYQSAERTRASRLAHLQFVRRWRLARVSDLFVYASTIAMRNTPKKPQFFLLAAPVILALATGHVGAQDTARENNRTVTLE